jgi:aspartyl-tRNA(Asn)/glutamyl-tRNA(Gln) amidotransferase subunit A
LAIGGDTGGSIRLPASARGARGLKPTFGRVSNYGSISNTWSRDCAGPMAWHVEDLGCGLEAEAGFDLKDATTVKLPPFKFDPSNTPMNLTGRRVGVVNMSHHDYAELLPDVRAGIDNVVKILQQNAAEIIVVGLPSTLAQYSSVGSPISNIEFHLANFDLIMSDPAVVGQGTRDRLTRVLNTIAIQYSSAKQQALDMTARMVRLFEDFEVLVLPGTFYTEGRFSEPKELSVSCLSQRCYQLQSQDILLFQCELALTVSCHSTSK